MGLIGWVLSQTVMTGVALAALRRNGVVTVEPSRIKNETARLLFVSVLQGGDTVCEFGERLWRDVSKNLK